MRQGLCQICKQLLTIPHRGEPDHRGFVYLHHRNNRGQPCVANAVKVVKPGERQ